MSRIEDALKRITGAGTEPRQVAGLEGYTGETGYRPEEKERKVSTFAAGPIPVEGKPTAPPKAAASTVPVTPPVQSEPDAETETEAPTDTEKLIDLRPVADYLSFIGGSVWRHKVLASATFLFVLAVTIALTLLLPRTYHAETKLLAQRNEVIAALSNPGRTVPWDADAPTRAASETILKRDNLVMLIKETNLLNEWDRTRIPLLKFKDWVLSFVQEPLTPADKLDQLIGLLEQRLIVTAGPVGDGTVTIDLWWPNADQAYRMVDAAQRAFIDARQKAERAAIGESIGILQNYSTTLHENINKTLTELERTRALNRSAAGITIPRRSAPAVTAFLPPVPDAVRGVPSLGAGLDDPEIPRLNETLTATRKDIANLEDQRQRQLSDLQAQLDQLTTIYTPVHPAVRAVQQHIAALSRDTPQLTMLKAQLSGAESEYKKRMAAAAEQQQVTDLESEFASRARAAAARRAAPTEAATPAPAPQANAPGSEDSTDFASIRLRLELSQLESVLERTDGARIELAVSDAAFKYRYSVIRPPQVPREPVQPNLRLILIAGILGSIFLSVAAAVSKDLFSRRIFDPWQIERQLGLPVLGTLGNA